MADLDRLTEVIEPEAQALGFELGRVKMMPSEAGDGGEALQIMAEDPATGQLVIEQCAALSRRVSDRIDALEEQGDVLIAGAYHLEVSSPGIDRPLTRAKDFANWAGHEAILAGQHAIWAGQAQSWLARTPFWLARAPYWRVATPFWPARAPFRLARNQY